MKQPAKFETSYVDTYLMFDDEMPFYQNHLISMARVFIFLKFDCLQFLLMIVTYYAQLLKLYALNEFV